MRFIIIAISCLGLILAYSASAVERSSTNYRILQDAVSVGGGEAGASTNYKAYESTGEQGGGVLTSTNYKALGNFRYLWIEPFLTASMANTSLGFGTLTTADDFWANTAATGSTTEPATGNTSQITTATNATYGLIISARSTGSGNGQEGNGTAGLYRSAALANLIDAAGAASISAGGTEGYGLYLKNNGAGGNVTIASGFDNAPGDTAISTTGQTVASTTGPIDAANTVDLYLKAAINTITSAGSYADTIIVTITGRY